MALLNVDELVASLIETIETKLATDPEGEWRASRFTPDQFGRESEVEHHGFTVWPEQTSNIAPGPKGLKTTQIQIKWAHRLRPEAVQLDLRAAMRSEQLLSLAVESIGLDEIKRERSEGRDGLVLLGRIDYIISHRVG